MNIFVVEDERWALAEMVELLKAYRPEHRVFAFDNGDDALTAADGVRPDLVLTDVNMPGIDGLELIEQLHKLDPTIKSMIVSVHDEFEYARQGMKFGVVDYLLKPVKKDDLVNAVDKAVQRIETDSKRREQWMNGSIAQMLVAAEIPVHADLQQINAGAYCMVLLILDKHAELKGWKDAGLHADAMREIFTSAIAPTTQFHCVELDCWQKVVLIPLTGSNQMGAVKTTLASLYQQLHRLPAPIHIGLAHKSEQRSLYDTLYELKQRMDEQMTFGMCTFLSDDRPLPDVDLSTVWEKVRLMEWHFNKSEIAKGQTALHRILDELRQRQITRRQMRLFIHDLLFSLKYNLLAARTGAVNVNVLQEDISAFHRLSGYVELSDWLSEKVIGLYCSERPTDRTPRNLVPVLLQIIHNNYQGTLSLQQFAADHHVSLGYLSRIFKSQTGSTFSDYVTGYRIRKAKELLSGGIERLQEVSRLVGYEDPKHFSALFKKIVGQTPMAYARSKLPATGRE
ncbi:response regulator transcription factor [Paenibacillus xerothermodurans]|uniref:Response regulator n=1 Tax=Paenibacillus xerothermodurans TaxID=1977292 RepID=A0A2W1NF46_PAEXE|nr:response regulator [Paenibacillus xerothermodurans]PZE22300.1 response regulator [Paenibacillus xerothermodurans]